ncbi:TolC family protein [Ancylomarina sp. 16SWW S1-10-2]|uniref:TolC family protein n=1 Tax=Ancylomarina sp. 16SWW S1-10-2 TaxID=2499681 RepID=UPI0012ADB17E|nr:TolC family protein [Ancylomarina sp. 16SWW S1-10-2]MRT94422.1 TolC family protein [Ancylomarina sp. 16SWW S1-10-2]
MRTILKFFFSSIFCLSIFSLKAQDPIVLSLDSAVNYAIIHNKTLTNSRFAIDKSSQQIKEAISKGLPQIDASIDYTSFLGAEASLQLDPAAAPAVIKFNPTSNFNLSASQLIFNGNYIVGIQMAKLTKSITEQSYQKDELDVKDQTIQAYYMILASERILNTLKGNLKNAKTLYEKTSNLANAGIIEQTDAKKLSVMVTSVNNAVKSNERQVELAYNLLRLNLGLDSNQQITLSTSLDDITTSTQLNPIENFNIENNMDYKLISIQGEISKKSINMAKASYLPSLVAFYSYTKKLKEPVFDMSPKNSLGLTLNIPLFSGGMRRSQLNQAKIDYDINNNTKDLLVDQLNLQEKQLEFNYENLLEQYYSQEKNVQVAKEVLEQMNRKFQQGVASSLDITSANNDYLSAETDLTGTLLQLLNAKLALRKLNNNI